MTTDNTARVHPSRDKAAHPPGWLEPRLVNGLGRSARPEIVPAGRAELVAWLTDPRHPRTTTRGARVEFARVAQDAAAGVLLHVGERLAAMVVQAAAVLPDWYRLRRADLPVTAGFCAFGGDDPVPVGGDAVRAAVWGPRRGAWAVTLWAPGAEPPPEHEEPVTPRLVAALTLPVPPRRPGRAPVPAPVAELGDAARLVAALWLLLDQDHAVTTTQVPPQREIHRAVARYTALPPNQHVQHVDLRPSETGPALWPTRGWWRPQRPPADAEAAATRPWWVLAHG